MQHPLHPNTLMPAFRQIILQVSIAILVLALCWPHFLINNTPAPWGSIAALIGTTALVIARVSRQPWWWQLIHGAFAPCVWLLQRQEIPPNWYLAAFIVLLLLFRGAAQGQIPLYLSSHKIAETLSHRLPANAYVLDLGAGVGSLLVPLTRLRPDLDLVGVENAPIPWATGKLRALGKSRIQWHWGNLWDVELYPFDAAYCFLSPTPMGALWKRASTQMRPGTWFISNSFPIPDVTPQETLDLDGDGQRKLYFYRIPEH